MLLWLRRLVMGIAPPAISKEKAVRIAQSICEKAGYPDLGNSSVVEYPCFYIVQFGADEATTPRAGLRIDIHTGEILGSSFSLPPDIDRHQ